jgi:rifampicin phosphotransferase
MNLISEPHEISAVSLVGGKGNHLQKLISWGAPVPPFFVITTEAFRIYKKTNNIPPLIEKRFASFLKSHPKIALRSSMISEDNIDSSFAGLFETLLDVDSANWKDSLIRIFDSVHSPRVSEYIQKKGLSVDLQMAVVAQELLEVDKSGVLFTRSPVPPTAAIAIDAAFGMGEGVVSGHADVDHYLVTRFKEVIETRINNEQQVLHQKEMDALIDLALECEKHAGVASDLEWGFKEGRLYLFQIRPITRSFDNLTYFVDTNLSESYPGVVSPFTGAFVKKAYENVFRESAMIMGARGKKLETLGFHYARLISSVDDHLYYNLEHYYAVLRALPGGEKNIENWHKMIGGEIEEVTIPYHPTELTNVETVQTVFHLLNIALRRKTIFGNLLNDLQQMREDIEKEILNLKTSGKTIGYLSQLINRPLGFGLTVVNDVFIMMGLGYLGKVLKKRGLPEAAVIDLLKTSEGVESVKPLEHFNEMITSLDDEFIQALARADLQMGFEPYSKLFHKLRTEGWEKETEALSYFLKLYGDRSFEELKLESLPLRNNPFLLKELISWAKRNPSLSNISPKNSPEIILNGLDGKILRFTRDAIAMREATRLWRGKFYHLLRQLVLKLARLLKAEDTSWSEFSLLDFFSLTPQEWEKMSRGILSREEIQERMRNRREWITKKKHYPEIISWVENEPLPGIQKDFSPGTLEGQGVSPGIAEGIALVLENPLDALTSEYREFILVTKNTDPAWVYIMSRSLGLISEKGSLLSHTAIIGRELNIPTIVGVRMATQKIRTGDRIRIDATKGTIEII